MRRLAALAADGHDVLLSAPAEDKSGMGSQDREPSPRDKPCHYRSCPAGSGPWGLNASRPELHWVNSFPATAMRYGIDVFGRRRWGSARPVELAVSGPNAGANVWFGVLLSDTVGAACRAVTDSGVPAIAFSAHSPARAPWDADLHASPLPAQSRVYAQLAARLVRRLGDAGAPYLPAGVFLNVNFHKASGRCADPAAYRWILTRINPPGIGPGDVPWCGHRHLPHEWRVLARSDGCYATVSIGDAHDKSTMNNHTSQRAVIDKLRDGLSCLPS